MTKRYVHLDGGELKRDDGFIIQRSILPSGESLTIESGYSMVVAGTFEVSGTLQVDGVMALIG
jgi:hypothetical protein